MMLDNMALESPRENGFETPRSHRQETDEKIMENISALKQEFLKDDKFKGLGRSMTVFDLDDHITNSCPKSRFCYECEILFDTKVELVNHYKRECPYIMV